MKKLAPPTSPPAERKNAPHERLKAWHACYDLTMAVFRACLTGSHLDSDPEGEEEYNEVGFGDELMGDARRTAQQATIALMTGANQSDPQVFWRYTEEAGAHLAQLSSELILAQDLGVIDHRIHGELEALRDHAARLTWGLRTSLKRKLAEGEKSDRRKTRVSPVDP